MEEFKDRLYSLRKEKNYSQSYLAVLLNVSKSTVAMWETGQRMPMRESYEALADIFNVDIDYLYCKSDVKRKVTFDEFGNSYFDTNNLDVLLELNNDTKMKEILENYYFNANESTKAKIQKLIILMCSK